MFAALLCMQEEYLYVFELLFLLNRSIVEGKTMLLNNYTFSAQIAGSFRLITFYFSQFFIGNTMNSDMIIQINTHFQFLLSPHQMEKTSEP